MIPSAVSKVLDRHGLSTSLLPSLGAEADAAAAQLTPEGLVDRTDLPFCTIDEAHSKDLDQALVVQSTEGGWRVWYALADASHFVKPGSGLFKAALRTGSSVYVPGQVFPMLPRVLSEGAISLNPGVGRRAVLFCIDLDQSGREVGVQAERAWIKSRAKLTYEGVQAFLDGGALASQDQAVQQSLRDLRSVGNLRMSRAVERNVVRFRRMEARVAADGKREELRYVASADLRNDVERYNEQISLLTNIVGARLLQEALGEGMPVHPIYRIHDPPREEQLKRFRDRVRELVAARQLPADWLWDGHEALAAYLARLPTEGELGRTGDSIHRQAILTIEAADYSSAPGAHFGIGAEVYGRFTAPMREVIGIFLHKELFEAQGQPAWHGDEALREQVIQAARRGRSIQRDVDRAVNLVALDHLFASDLSMAETPVRAGTIMGVSPTKLYVALDEPPMEVKIYTRNLGSELGPVTCDPLRTQMRAGTRTFCLGDGVRAQVQGKDEKGRWRLVIR